MKQSLRGSICYGEQNTLAIFQSGYFRPLPAGDRGPYSALHPDNQMRLLKIKRHEIVRDSVKLGSHECFSLKSVYIQSLPISEVPLKCSYQLLGAVAASAPRRLRFSALTCLSGLQDRGLCVNSILRYF